MSKSAVEIFEQLAAAKEAAALDLDSVPFKLKGSMAISKADAQAALPKLREEYREHLVSRVATIFLSGPTEYQLAFAEMAEKEGETLTVSSMGAYEKMAQDIEPTIGAERQFGGTQLGHLLRSLETIAREAGASFVVTPRLKEVVTVSDFQALALAVRSIIIEQVGEKLNAQYVEKQILDQALATSYTEKVVPVVVIGLPAGESEELRQGIFSGRGIQLELTKKPDKASVLAAFAALREALKKQS